MKSELHSQTARRNGSKSRGPVSPAGKTNSARSRYTHGLLSRTIVIEGEEAARFSALLRSLRQQYQPQNPTEETLVEDLATCHWRQRRILAMETSCYSREIQRQLLHSPDQSPDQSNAERATLAFTTLNTGTAVLDLLSRHEHRFKRQYQRTLNLLLSLRASQALNPPLPKPGK